MGRVCGEQDTGAHSLTVPLTFYRQLCSPCKVFYKSPLSFCVFRFRQHVFWRPDTHYCGAAGGWVPVNFSYMCR